MVGNWLLLLGALAGTEVFLHLPKGPAPTSVVLDIRDAEGVSKVLSVPADDPKLFLTGPGPWQVRVVQPSLWPESFVVPPSQKPGEQLRLWWKAELLVSPKNSKKLPEQVKATLFPPRGADVSSLDLRCEPHPDGWQCAAPAGTWRLKVRIPGFVSVRVEELELVAGKSLEIREIPLRPEARLTGFLSPTPDKPLPLWLLPVKPVSPMPTVVEEPFYREDALTDRDGAFSFSGLEGGTYELRLGSGCGARVLRLSLTPASLVNLPPLSVACGGSLQVRVSPQLQGPWEIFVFPREDGQGVVTAVTRGKVLGGGTWISSPLPEGSYSVTLTSQEGETLSSEEVWVDHSGAVVDFGHEGFSVRGTISYGGKPWKGRFRFVKVEDAPLEIHVNTDDEGRFLTYLPHQGHWFVSPLSEFSRLEEALGFEATPGRTLDIQFPATRLSGYVHGEGLGSGSAFLYVVARSFSTSGSCLLGQNGFFNLEGLPEGEYWVQAVSDKGSSPVFSVRLADGAPLSQDLWLVPYTFLELGLTDGEQPVAGGLVHFRPFGEGVPVNLFPPAPVPSDSRGIARLPVPPQAVAVGGLVFAPPYGVASFLCRAPLPPSVRLTLSQSGGSLVIPPKVVLGGRKQPREYVLPVVGDYVLDVFAEVASWRETYGTVPGFGGTALLMAPPGHHQLCLVPSERLLETLTVFPPPTDLSCTSGRLSPNGILRLKMPGRRIE